MQNEIIKNKENFTLIGGDERNISTANRLCDLGMNVSVFGFIEDCIFHQRIHRPKTLQEAIKPANYILLPLPYSTNNETINTPLYDKTISIYDILSLIDNQQTIFAGKLNKLICAELENKNIPYFDYSIREEFAVLNAIPTAEGAILIALRELPFTINGSDCLVLGFGRIAKILAHALKGMGAQVFVSARRHSDLAFIKSYGYDAVPINQMAQIVENKQIIFNTVPHLLLDREALSHVPKNSLIIDLASKPGGTDFEAAEKLGLKTVHALSLPGKVAPLTAGTIICDTILNIIKETEVKE